MRHIALSSIALSSVKFSYGKLVALCSTLVAVFALTLTSCSSHREISEEDMMRHQSVVEGMKDRQFVMKATRMVVNRHSFNSVSSSTNFVMVDGDEATVQVSPGIGGGPNGVGGFTVKGSISGYEMVIKPNGSVALKFHVTASIGSCSVFINLPKDGINATATINNTFRGKNATLYGPVSDLDNSVFVGRTRY